MRRALMLSGALSADCSAAGYISGGNQQSTGDVWYSRSTYIPLFGVAGSSAPYYCRADGARSCPMHAGDDRRACRRSHPFKHRTTFPYTAPA